MLSTATLRKHAALVDDMASANGIDLQEQSIRGHLTPSDLDDAVLRCTGCSCADACGTWLAQNTTTADAPPSYCRNTPLFEELRKA